MKTKTIFRNIYYFIGSGLILLIGVYYGSNYLQYHRLNGKYNLVIIDKHVLIGLSKNNKKLYSQTSLTLRINKAGQYILYTSPCFLTDIGISKTISAGSVRKKGNAVMLEDYNHAWKIKLVFLDSGLFCLYGFRVMIGKSFYIDNSNNRKSEETENSNSYENEEVVRRFFDKYKFDQKPNTFRNHDKDQKISFFSSGLYRSTSECQRECLKLGDDSTFCYYFNETPVFKAPIVISQGTYSKQGGTLILYDPIIKIKYIVFLQSGGLYVGIGLPGGQPGLFLKREY